MLASAHAALTAGKPSRSADARGNSCGQAKTATLLGQRCYRRDPLRPGKLCATA